MIISFFFWVRIGLFALAYLASLILPRIANSAQGAVDHGKNFNYWLSWAQWDGGHFKKITVNGYHFFTDYAFMPLYPYTVRLLNKLVNNVLLSGLIISNLCFLAFLIVLSKIISQKFDKKTTLFTIATYLLFPTSFFTAAFYSESMFLLFVSLCFFFLYRKNYLFASVFCAFASLTRFVGIFLFIAIIYTYFTQIKFNIKKINLNLIYILASPIFLIIYSLLLWRKFQMPFLFITSERFWARAFIDPFTTIILSLWTAGTSIQTVSFYFDLIVTFLFIIILILGRRKIPSSMWIYSMLVILAGISSGTLVSMPRYVLASVGSFVILGNFFQKRQTLGLFVYSFALVTQVVLAALFINGFWIS